MNAKRFVVVCGVLLAGAGFLVARNAASAGPPQDKTLQLSGPGGKMVEAPITEVHIEWRGSSGNSGLPMLRIASYQDAKTVRCDVYTASLADAAQLRSQVLERATTLVICGSHRRPADEQSSKNHSVEIYLTQPNNGDELLISGGG